jgi:hypothetical protein
MLQQCSSASSCMRKRNFTEEHYTGCQHSTPFVLNGPRSFLSVLQYTFDVFAVPYCMNFTVSTPILFQETVAISLLADNVCLKISACLVNVCASTALTAIWFRHS